MTDERTQRNEIESAFGPDATREALGLTWEELAIGLWSENNHLRATVDGSYQRGYDMAGSDFNANFEQAARDDQCLHGDTFFTRATTAGDRCPWCVIDEMAGLIDRCDCQSRPVAAVSPPPTEDPQRAWLLKYLYAEGCDYNHNVKAMAVEILAGLRRPVGDSNPTEPDRDHWPDGGVRADSLMDADIDRLDDPGTWQSMSRYAPRAAMRLLQDIVPLRSELNRLRLALAGSVSTEQPESGTP